MTVLQNNTSFMDEKLFTVKEPMSALTHLIGAVCSIFAMPVLLIHASLYHATKLDLIAYMIFMISMILLYSASTVYHSFSISPKVNKTLKKIDHMMIFIMIAGSYTPVALNAMKLSIFEKPIHGFGNHEIFHCFILAGSLCHFIFMYHYLVLLM